MTYPLSQSQLSIYLACQGLEPEGGNYQQAIGPNPQSPIPNPQSPIPI